MTRNKDYSYDRGNLYHSIEYAQNDLIQLGRYKEASQQFQRMEEALQLQREASQNEMDENGIMRIIYHLKNCSKIIF